MGDPPITPARSAREALYDLLVFGGRLVSLRPHLSGGWHPGELAWSFNGDDAALQNVEFRRDAAGVVGVGSLDGGDLWVEATPEHDRLVGDLIASAQAQAAPGAVRVRAFDDDVLRTAWLADRNWEPVAAEGLLFAIDLTRPVPETADAAGFRVGDCVDVDIEARVRLHREAWSALDHIGLPGVTSEFSIDLYRKLRSVQLYDPSLDIIAFSPDGQMVASCIAWGDAASGVGVFEPVGVHPLYRGRRLASLVLHEGLRRLRERGLTAAHVGTAHFNNAAAKGYSAAGFSLVGRSRWWAQSAA